MLMTDKVRVAFIGAGNLANGMHYPNLASLDDVDLAATCDLFVDKAQATAKRFGIPRVYSDYEKMLAEVDPQVVYAIMPPQDIFAPASAVLRQGRHLFVEKPLGMTAHQARLLAYLAKEHSCLTAVGFQRRHIPALTAFKRRVEERGPIQQATVGYLKSFDLSQHAGLYGGIIDNLTVDGCHAVDTLRFLCGGEVEQVAAHVRTRRAPGTSPNEFTALVSFSSGAVGILNSSYATGRRIFRVEFHGPNITAYVDADRDSYIVADNGEAEVYESQEFGTADGAPGDSPRHWRGQWHQTRQFIDCVKAGRQPLTNFAEAAKTMELVERIHTVGSA